MKSQKTVLNLFLVSQLMVGNPAVNAIGNHVNSQSINNAKNTILRRKGQNINSKENIIKKFVSKNESVRTNQIKNTQLRTWPEFAKNTINYANEERYNRLISGLDNDSVNTVNKILERLKSIANGVDKIYCSDEEKNVLASIRRDLVSKKISDNCWKIKDYLFPREKGPGASVLFYKHGITNFDENKLQILRGKDIIDAGAYIGDSALIFSDYTDKKVYSFEPSTPTFELMQRTIEMNKKDNIVPVNAALADENKTVLFPLGVSGSNSFTRLNGPTETVKVTTIDQFVKENNLNVGLIKTDVEGAEQALLKGAEMTIREQKPLLLISIYHKASDFFDIKPLIESWNLGYKFKIFKGIDGHVSHETLLIGTPS